jgi:hypothetical protein
LLGVEDRSFQISRVMRDVVVRRVEDRELLVSELARCLGGCTQLQESNADHEVVVLPSELVKRGDERVAHTGRTRRDRLRLDVQVALRSHQPTEGAILERIACASDERLL